MTYGAAQFWLHVTVLLWGLTAVLGKLIQTPALSLTFYRQMMVAAVMWALVLVWKRRAAIGGRAALQLGLVGTLVSVHWVLFYQCVQQEGIETAVLCLSTSSLFTALFEPMIFKRPYDWREFGLGLLVVVGIACLNGVVPFASARGLTLGIGAAAFGALFGTFNGVMARRYDAEVVSAYELTAGALASGLFAWQSGALIHPAVIGASDWQWIVVLSVACTIAPWLISLRVLRVLEPFALSVALSLEPVYAVIIAFFVFDRNERLPVQFYAGASVLLGTVALSAWFKRSRVGDVGSS